MKFGCHKNGVTPLNACSVDIGSMSGGACLQWQHHLQHENADPIKRTSDTRLEDRNAGMQVKDQENWSWKSSLSCGGCPSWRRREATGNLIFERYADMFVAGFEHDADARSF